MAKNVDYSGNLFPPSEIDAVRLLKKMVLQKKRVNLDFMISILTEYKLKITKYPSLDLITQAVQDNNEEAFEFFINYFDNKINGTIAEKIESYEEFLKYINNNKGNSSKSGFSALGYATYFEFQDMALRLIDVGADYRQVNDEGDSILHLSVRGGSLKVLMKLQELGVDIYEKNQYNISTFQIACLEGNLHIMKYLLKMNEFDGGNKININEALESTDETALHFGVFSQEYAVVKYLMIQGANKQAKNNENQTPYEKALQIQKETKEKLQKIENGEIGEDIENIDDNEDKESLQQSLSKIKGIISLLGKISLLKRLQLQTRVGPTKGMNKYSLILKFINILGFVGLLVVIPYSDSFIPVSITFLIIECISFINLFLTSRKDPGQIEKYGYRNFNEEKDGEELSQKQIFFENFKQLLANREYEDLCLECCIIKPQRSKHCDFCKKCISVMDHHCPFVKTCIGSKNHKYFFFMLVTQLLCQLFIAFICIESLYQLYFDTIDDENSGYIISNFSFIYNETTAYIFSFVLLFQFLVTIIPIAFMVWNQIRILTYGCTSLEMRYYYQRKQQAKIDVDNIPVTEIPNRTKSKQYQESSSSSTHASQSRFQSQIKINDGQEAQENMENSTKQETDSVYTARSKQQLTYEVGKIENSKWKNFKNMLYGNANDPIYQGDLNIHVELLTKDVLGYLPKPNQQQYSQSTIRDSLLENRYN